MADYERELKREEEEFEKQQMKIIMDHKEDLQATPAPQEQAPAQVENQVK